MYYKDNKLMELSINQEKALSLKLDYKKDKLIQDIKEIKELLDSKSLKIIEKENLIKKLKYTLLRGIISGVISISIIAIVFNAIF